MKNTVHNLLLAEQLNGKDKSNYVVLPQLSLQQDMKIMSRQFLKDGELIQVKNSYNVVQSIRDREKCKDDNLNALQESYNRIAESSLIKKRKKNSKTNKCTVAQSLPTSRGESRERSTLSQTASKSNIHDEFMANYQNINVSMHKSQVKQNKLEVVTEIEYLD